MRALIAGADRLCAGERSLLRLPERQHRCHLWTGTTTRLPTTDGRLIASSRIDHRVATQRPEMDLGAQSSPAPARARAGRGCSPAKPRYAELAFDHLDSWLEQNPVGTGIAWRGAFEAGLRAISVAIALQGLRHSSCADHGAVSPRGQGPRRRARRYCWHGRSRFSSANNHLIGELAGLVTVHLLFPELAAPASLYSSRHCATLAEPKPERQILPDGAGAEQSASLPDLHRQSCCRSWSRCCDCAVIGRRRSLDRGARAAARGTLSSDRGLPTTRTLATETMTTVLRSGWVSSPKRTVAPAPRDCMSAIGRKRDRRTVRLPNLDAAVVHGLARHAPSVPSARRVGRARRARASMRRDGGAGGAAHPGSRRLTMDVGPLGYLSIAAHGHADALAVTLERRWSRPHRRSGNR